MNIPTGVAGKKFLKNIAVMNFSTGHLIFSDQLMLYINRYMILTTKKVFAVLFSLTGIYILLSFLVPAPSFRLLVVFDLLIFLVAVSLNRDFDYGSVGNLPFSSFISIFIVVASGTLSAARSLRNLESERLSRI